MADHPYGEYDGFRERLFGSRAAMEAVKAWLERNGREVVMPELMVFPEGSDYRGYADNGDLFIVDPIAGHMRIEVKHLPEKNFDGPDNWPFKEILISKKGSVDRAKRSVTAYVTVNAQMTHAAIVLGSTKDSWYVTEKFARNQNQFEVYYASPLKNIIYRRIKL
jgi:hypothetical protein